MLKCIFKYYFEIKINKITKFIKNLSFLFIYNKKSIFFIDMQIH